MKENINKSIAENLRLIMSSKGRDVTVKSLSERTGLARGTISNIRNGHQHYSWQVVIIANALKIPPGLLLHPNLSDDRMPLILTLLSIDEPDRIKDVELAFRLIMQK